MEDTKLKSGSQPGTSPRTLFGAYLLQAFALVVCLIVYKAGEDPVSGLLASSLRYALMLAAVLLVSGVVLILHDWLSHGDTKRMVHAVNLSLVSTLLLIALVEVGLRITMTLNPGIASVFPRGFLPKDWDEVAGSNLALLAGQDTGDPDTGAFLVYDEFLGWKPGASRSGEHGMYVSSVEGLRSNAPLRSFRNTTAAQRIALVGDSYTFGLGVAFEDTWGERLQDILGDDYQVLNFGVAGYGADQAYLRYLKDVDSWNPDIVVLGLISHDFPRSQIVYPFIAFPKWQIPFAKPRHILEDGQLLLTNVPLDPPETLFVLGHISELPVIELEPTYFAPEWNRRWYHGLYTARFLISASPRWPPPQAGAVASMKSVNSMIVREFAEATRNDGRHPVVVFFPSYGPGEVGASRDALRAAQGYLVGEVLSDAGIEYLNLVPCLEHVPPSKGIASDGQHYSPEANRLVAACIHEYLQRRGLLRSDTAIAQTMLR